MPKAKCGGSNSDDGIAPGATISLPTYPETPLTARCRESFKSTSFTPLGRIYADQCLTEIERLTARLEMIHRLIPPRFPDGTYDLEEATKAYLFEQVRDRIYTED